VIYHKASLVQVVRCHVVQQKNVMMIKMYVCINKINYVLEYITIFK